MIGIFIHGKEETPGVFQHLLDQAGIHHCSLYETGKVLCRELIPGGPVSVSNEEEYPWFSDEKRGVRSYRMVANPSEAASSLDKPRQIWSLLHEAVVNRSYRNGT